MSKSCGCTGRCQCDKKVVYPTREEVKHTHSEETVCHIHPSHTRVINNHKIRNKHFYPHSTSYENRVQEVDVRGASEGPGENVLGAADYGCGDNRVGGARNCGCRGRCCCGGRRRRGFWF